MIREPSQRRLSRISEPHCIRRPLKPVAPLVGLFGGKDVDETVGELVEAVCLHDVPVEAGRQELWVSTKTRLIPELMQFDRGMSIIRYLPAKPTAGLALLSVSG
jgi:hypothetical protein